MLLRHNRGAQVITVVFVVLVLYGLTADGNKRQPRPLPTVEEQLNVGNPDRDESQRDLMEMYQKQTSEITAHLQKTDEKLDAITGTMAETEMRRFPWPD
jgi:hypothetical protein